MTKTKINVIKAYHGDCLLIESFDKDGNEYNVLIDGGTRRTFQYGLKLRLKKLSVIHLLVLTHIDSDHIMGIIAFFKSALFKQIKIERFWINGANLAKINSGESISYNQGVTIEKLLIAFGVDTKIIESEIFDGFEAEFPTGISIDVLSPTKEILKELYQRWPELEQEITESTREISISAGSISQIKDDSLISLAKKPFFPAKTIESDIFNSSSIAFLFKSPDLSILLLADSRAEVILEALKARGYNSVDRKLKVDYIKISHHGSKNNTSCELLDLIECDKFIISTNGGNSNHKHPEREVIARIIHHPTRNYLNHRQIIFNYPMGTITEKCGLIYNDEDLKIGNWSVIDDCQLLLN
ncbi:MBL fold hydrolase [Dyadobacter frigoris]|uniref:ComEC/Rec2 family competence protein n=1 Tax=Dyadobacter frigoris TaxID=2576211 RepID=UPI0024A2BBBB|nr:MBL fold metallo-hydrolase [Dyadobacter frigoris]GLU57328.1 MBL fold hydrolase [Dyadobacter frigoris]